MEQFECEEVSGAYKGDVPSKNSLPPVSTPKTSVSRVMANIFEREKITPSPVGMQTELRLPMSAVYHNAWHKGCCASGKRREEGTHGSCCVRCWWSRR